MTSALIPQGWERVWSSVLDHHYLRSLDKKWTISPDGEDKVSVWYCSDLVGVFPIGLFRQDLIMQLLPSHSPEIGTAQGILIALLRELHPKDVVASYLDGEPPVTAKEMIALAEKGDTKAKGFFADILRISRDLMVRKARRDNRCDNDNG